ncbi:element excision factor XisH family protein [Nostoc mirabile]|uniref:element excision factor XisH family protein n=1 Tax=Nostoc mirabile TaxID=2907820 RepID=UPI0022797750|nr:element excision factor XisH family protein [Nostoc mirabile]
MISTPLPLTFKQFLDFDDGNKLNEYEIDLAAENAIAAERDTEKIAVEIKSFIAGSDINEFHTALGQYLNYCLALEENQPERIVYLAVPHET